MYFQANNPVQVVHKPSSVHAGAYAYPLERGYTVCCAYCCAVIGTMTGDILLRAIMAMAGRGGVLCPSCRKRYCDNCGVIGEARTYQVRLQEDDVGIRLCKPCLL